MPWIARCRSDRDVCDCSTSSSETTLTNMIQNLCHQVARWHIHSMRLTEVALTPPTLPLFLMVAAASVYDMSHVTSTPAVEILPLASDFELDALDQFNQLLDNKVVSMHTRAELANPPNDPSPDPATSHCSEERLVTADFVAEVTRHHRRTALNRAAQQRFRQKRKVCENATPLQHVD